MTREYLDFFVTTPLIFSSESVIIHLQMVLRLFPFEQQFPVSRDSCVGRGTRLPLMSKSHH